VLDCAIIYILVASQIRTCEETEGSQRWQVWWTGNMSGEHIVSIFRVKDVGNTILRNICITCQLRWCYNTDYHNNNISFNFWITKICSELWLHKIGIQFLHLFVLYIYCVCLEVLDQESRCNSSWNDISCKTLCLCVCAHADVCMHTLVFIIELRNLLSKISAFMLWEI
jgi:hypothetical protein